MNETLKRAVIRTVGRDSLRDVAEHWADADYPGFTYYKDTCRFFRNHKKAIVEMAEAMARDIGKNVLDMILGFRRLNNDFTTAEVGKVIYGNWQDDTAHTMIGNALAWFALEEVAREEFKD